MNGYREAPRIFHIHNALITLVWRTPRSQTIGLRISWVFEDGDIFEVYYDYPDLKTPDYVEGFWFNSPELAAELRGLAQSHSFRTWISSNPEIAEWASQASEAQDIGE